LKKQTDQKDLHFFLRFSEVVCLDSWHDKKTFPEKEKREHNIMEKKASQAACSSGG
jgi:hypothetical protein